MILKQIPISHDAYLKCFQRQKKKLRYDLIILDEAQDATECIVKILQNQYHSAKILIGDMHQQIYKFRGESNPFRRTYKTTHFTLYETYRFGVELAHFSSLFLEIYKNNKTILKSANPNNTRIFLSTDDYPENKWTLLCRSNYRALVNALYYAHFEEKTIHMLENKPNFEKEIQIMYDLLAIDEQRYNDIIYPKLKHFSSLTEIIEYYKLLKKYKWLCRIRLFQQYGLFIIQLYNSLELQYRHQNEADIVISTVHKSKGLGFDNVVIDSFFPVIMNDSNEPIKNLKKDEIDIIFTALTRAKKTIYLNESLTAFYEYIYH